MWRAAFYMQCTNKPVCSKLFLYVKNEDGVMVWLVMALLLFQEIILRAKWLVPVIIC